MRKKYWSCTKFADFIRGTDKPCAETGKGWNEWRKKAKKEHPFRYWVSEEFLDTVQNILWYPLDKVYDVKYYINNRWVTRTHQLSANPNDIKPGDWRDLGNRFLPCLFNELVDFVEIELAWSHIAWSDKEERKKYNAPFWATGWFRWRTWRCPQAGLDHLEWAKDLTNADWLEEDQKHLAELTPQAIAAREILDLYNWWKNIYPNRPDPLDASGWTKLCSDRREKQREEGDNDAIYFLSMEDETPEEREEKCKILDLSSEIEKNQKQEEEDMMIRLIKIRESLWT